MSAVSQSIVVANPNNRKLTKENQDPIQKTNHVKLFPMPLSIFKDFPVNSVFTETSEHNCIASEAEMSDQFSFIKSNVTGGIITIETSYLSAKLKIKIMLLISIIQHVLIILTIL